MSSPPISRFGFSPDACLRFSLTGAAATRRFGAKLGRLAVDGAFIGLVGNLGAGKTTLVQGLVGALDPDAEASSPTYTLLNEYATRPPVYHFDLYRLDGVDDLETIAYWDYAEDADAIVVVEWVDRVPAAWTGGGVLVVLEHEADSSREVTVCLPQALRASWGEELAEFFASPRDDFDLS